VLPKINPEKQKVVNKFANSFKNNFNIKRFDNFKGRDYFTKN